MSAIRRLQALQRTLTPSDIGSPISSHPLTTDAERPQRVLVLPDGGYVDIERCSAEGSNVLPLSQLSIDNIPVALIRHSDRHPVALVISSLGTPFETSANHVPKYPVLELQPPAHKLVISIADFWATVYTLISLYHHQEQLPVVLSPLLQNRVELETYVLNSGLGRVQPPSKSQQAIKGEGVLLLSRSAFWQGAGMVGYHGRGWLPTETSVPPFPYTPSFTRNEQVIAAHPLRPPKPSPGQLLYRRYCTTVKKALELHYVSLGEDGTRPSPHLAAFHRWHNNPRVNAGWGEMGTLEHHRSYLKKVLADPHVMPVMMSWDGELMGYVEFFWVKEDHLAQYMGVGDVGGAALDWDRGIHVLVGEDKFKGHLYSIAWLRSAIHYVLLADPRTARVMGEPRFDNEAIIQACLNANLHIQKIFDFPHKRSALVITSRDRWFSLDALY